MGRDYTQTPSVQRRDRPPAPAGASDRPAGVGNNPHGGHGEGAFLGVRHRLYRSDVPAVPGDHGPLPSRGTALSPGATHASCGGKTELESVIPVRKILAGDMALRSMNDGICAKYISVSCSRFSQLLR